MRPEAAMPPAPGLAPATPVPREWVEACFMLTLPDSGTGPAPAAPINESLQAATEAAEGAADQLLLLLAACALPTTPLELPRESMSAPVAAATDDMLPGTAPSPRLAEAAEAAVLSTAPPVAEMAAEPSSRFPSPPPPETAPAATLSATGLPVPPAAARTDPTPVAQSVHLQGLPPPPVEPADLAQSIVVAVQDGLQEAQIELHPAELGSVHIRIRVEDDKASLVFTVQHPQAREAVQTALPQLHLQLNNQGLQLADTQVFSQARHARPPPAPPRTAPETEAPKPVQRRLHRSGLLDHYV